MLASLRKTHISSYVISVDIVGLIENTVADLSDPRSKPVYELYFVKNRYRPIHETVLFDPEGTSALDFMVLTKEEIEALKIAIDEFHKGSSTVYIARSGGELVSIGC